VFQCEKKLKHVCAVPRSVYVYNHYVCMNEWIEMKGVQVIYCKININKGTQINGYLLNYVVL